MYRKLVDAGYHALRVTGHAHDAILVGEIASHGWIYPVPFVQALYCVDSHTGRSEAAAPACSDVPAQAAARRLPPGIRGCSTAPSPTTPTRSTHRPTR
jgi:hypothetical protein